MAESVETDLAKRIAKAGFARNMEVLEEYITPDTVLLGRQSEMDGESAIESSQNNKNTFELVDCEFDEVVTSNDEAVVFATTTYRVCEELLGIDFSDETYTTNVAIYLEFVDGRLAELRSVENREDMLSAMGILTDEMTGGNLLSDLTGDKIRLEYREVLSRLLRHNIRNKTAIITAIAEELLVDESTASLGCRLKDASDQLAGAADKAREIDQQIIAREPTPEPVAVRDVVETVVAGRESIDDTAVMVAGNDQQLTTDRRFLTSALEELVENAIEHAGESPEVTVAIEATDLVGYELAVTVTDDGPGIPEHELGPIRAEQETDLAHASGIGLWKLKWCVDRLEGDIEFEAPDTGGTRVRLSLPNIQTDID